MVAFSEAQNAKDTENLERVKDSVAVKAIDGDLQAAAVFASLIEAQTRRAELVAKDGAQPKAPEPVAEQGTLPWVDKVNATDTAPQIAVA